MMNYTCTVCTLLLLLAVTPAAAQIQLGGLADMELRKGGADSSPYVNQTPNDRWTVYTPYIRLFANSNISDNWYILTTLQADYYDGRSLSPPFFSVLNLNWAPIDQSDFTATIGRFVTPYGTYAERILSSENPFVHLPLSHASGLPLSKKRGVLYEGVDYGEVTGLTMIYQRMYAQGIQVQNRAGEAGWLRYTLAATLAPASSHFEVGQHPEPAFIGRVTLHPFVWGRIGLNVSTGPFMLRDTVNQALSDRELTSYRQTLYGADLKVSYHYYTFLAEYNHGEWNAPYIDLSGSVTEENLKTKVDHLSGELIIDFPFLPGGYAGVRYEKLLSDTIYDANSGTYGAGETWTYDRSRTEIVFGYKLDRNITLKASCLLSADTGPGLDDDVFTLQWSVGF